MKFPWRYLLVVAALTAGALLLPACGGEEEEAAAPTAVTEDTAVEEEEAEEAVEEDEEESVETLLDLGIIELEDALLTADDVPGLTPDGLEYYPDWHEDGEGFQWCDSDMTFPDYSRSAIGEYDYVENGNAVVVMHAIGVFDFEDGDAKKVADVFREFAEECGNSTATIDGSELKLRTTLLSLPRLGDETFAAQVAVEGEDFDWDQVTVIMRRGNIINEVDFYGEPGGIPTDLVQTLARAADEKLERLGE